MNPTLQFQDWGTIEYAESLAKQEMLLESTAQSQTSGTLVFCTHPPIVTLGRKTQPGDVFGWQGPTMEISRGGRATYHGPSQLVVYPIYNLDFPRPGKPNRDIAWYLRSLEDAIVETLAEYGVKAQGKSLQKKSSDDKGEDETGVWVENRKIASLGIGVRKWICFHGAAINLDRDPNAFLGMKPCGFNKETMVSLEEILGRKIDRSEFAAILKARILAKLG
jgi:lipoyl(octanoyl) transferase